MAEELHQGATTVIDLADHFGRLKLRALDFVQTFTASDRGFFTPTEDEQTRHLLVSYWQSRNALFELVSSFHRVERFPVNDRPTALAIAYAGALVLVDVARFLRAEFHHRPVVRAKLNEPEPYFGIPEGTYDRVQKSLTRPLHVWHLYHASLYFSRNSGDLQETAASNAELRDMLIVIAKYQQHMEVTVDRFLMARTRVRARSLSTRIGRDLFGRALYGLQKCVSSLISDKYVKTDHRPALPGNVMAEFAALLRPGDVIVVRKEHALTNYFLPGYWPHAALYVGSTDQLKQMKLDQHANVQPIWSRIEGGDCPSPGWVLESMKDGVRVRPLSNPFMSDAIAVIRPRLNHAQIAEGIGRGFFHVDKPYDFDFDFSRSDRLVCTEVVYRSFEGVGGLEFPLTRRAGRLTLSAEDLLQRATEGHGFDVRAVYCPALSHDTGYGAAAVGLLQKTIGRKFVESG